ncbi:MAG: extracellular solute-binding protein [Clostridia bacterium]|nr:extracellular solute-binding protein [Clostridia bacterium]
MKNRLLKLILILFLVSLLTACGAPQEEIVPEYGFADDGQEDFNGAVFYFAPWRVSMYFPQSGDTDAGDKMLARYAETEKHFNCTFTYINMDSESYDASAITSRYIAGLPVPDLIDREVGAAYSLYKANFLASMNDITTLDAEDAKFGPLYFRSQSIFDGSVYGFCPYEWEWMPEIHGVILTNNNLIRKMGLTSPYEIIEEGNWTWETMEDQLRLATYTDGDISYTGMLVKTGGTTPADMAQSAAFSNGAQMLIENNGKVVFGMTSPEAIRAFEYLRNLYEQKLCKDRELDNFINEEGPFYFTRSYEATSIEEGAVGYRMDDYGMIPFPKGPNNKGETGTYVAYDRLLYIVKMTKNDVESIGKVVDFMFEPLESSGGWKERSRYIFHHDQDIDFYIDGIENPSYNYQIQLGDNYDSFRNAIMNVLSGKETASAAMQSVESAINEYVAENGVELISWEKH